MIQIDDPYIYKITISIKSKRGYFLSAAIIDCSDIFPELPQNCQPSFTAPWRFQCNSSNEAQAGILELRAIIDLLIVVALDHNEI